MPSGGKRQGTGRPKVNTKEVLFRLTPEEEKAVRLFVYSLKNGFVNERDEFEKYRFSSYGEIINLDGTREIRIISPNYYDNDLKMWTYKDVTLR